MRVSDQLSQIEYLIKVKFPEIFGTVNMAYWVARQGKDKFWAQEQLGIVQNQLRLFDYGRTMHDLELEAVKKK